MEYKSWYLTFYEQQKQKKKAGIKTILSDVDFNIELVRTDKINVVYILNLLKEINRKDKEEMQKSIDLILREIDRSDNEKMRYKSQIMKDFIRLRFFDLDPEDDIMKEYEEYEKQVMEEDVHNFSKKQDIESEIILSIMNEYFMDEQSVTKDKIRQKIAYKKLPLLKQTQLINSIMGFIKDMYDKFTAEGV